MAERGGPAPGDLVELRIEKGVHRGLGLARVDGLVLLVAKGLPGERIEARVDARERGWLRGTVARVLEPSAQRRSAPCPHAETCGGCSWQELDYAAQQGLKLGVLRESLARAGAAWDGEIGMTPSPERGWRTRAHLHAAGAGERLVLGLHRAASHDVVEVDRCAQLGDGMRAVAAELAAALAARGAGAEVAGLRLAESGDATRLAALVELRGGGPIPRSLEGVGKGIPGLAGLGVQRGGRGRFASLWGSAWVDASAAGVAYRAHVASFFQANRFLLEPLVRLVLGALPPGAALLDLFAGVGLFSVAAAAQGDVEALAVEVSPRAVRDAEGNARRAGVADRVAVRRADALDGLRGWRPGRRVRAVIVDPPRTGLDAALGAALGGVEADRIVYVSCDPPTLGRDLARLARTGWHPRSLHALDLFPDTYHLETLVVLER